MGNIRVREAQASDRNEIARMCGLLWLETPLSEHLKDVDELIASGVSGTLPSVILVSHDDGGGLTGFLTVGLRSHADGCDMARPVGFVEGWFVHEAFRHAGVGKALMKAAEQWARSRGCTEMASDTWVDDEMSVAAHQALGFEIVDRCVNFRKKL